MKRLALALSLAVLSSCGPLQEAVRPDTPVDAQAIAPLIERVGARHDAYVDADPDLSEAQRADAKLDTKLLRQIVQAALGGGETE